MAKSELSIAAQFQELDYQLAITKCCFRLYQTIALDTSELNRTDHNNFAQYFGSFHRVNAAIFAQATFIQLYKFFDQHHKAIKIDQIIKSIQNEFERKAIQRKYDSLFSGHEKIIIKLRHKTYAHTDKYNSPDDLFQDIKTSYTDLKMIINVLEDIMHDISRSLNIVRMPNNPDEKIVQSEQLDMIKLVAQAKSHNHG